MAGPRITRHGKRLQVTQEHSRRLYDSKLYPVTSSNGSNVIISGTDNGLYITWSGGKPLYFTARSEGPTVNGTGNHTTADLEISEEPESDDEVLFESDEEEIDDDLPYPSVVQELEISLGQAILHIAVPELPVNSKHTNNAETPTLFTQSIVLATASSDGQLRLITLPLDPPSAATKRKGRLGARICPLEDSTRKGLQRGLALTYTAAAEDDANDARGRQTRSRSRSQVRESANPTEHALLVGALGSEFSGRLSLYRVQIHSNEEKDFILMNDVAPFQTLHLPAFSTAMAFNTATLPSEKHSHLLISDVQGYLRIHDALSSVQATRPGSSESRASQHVEQNGCISAFAAGFHMPRDISTTHPGLSQRKKILGAQWVRGGKAVLAILEDGEWGVWEIDASAGQAQGRSLNSPKDFAIRGFIGDAPETSSATSKSKPKSQLAPMTPNTRRVRQENLFHGPATQSGTASRGGVSATSIISTTGSPDDAVILWYNTNIYSIPSLSSLWARSTTGRETGSLYGPGLNRVENVDLAGEIINSIIQLPLRQTRQLSSGLGSMNIQRDILITTEHRTIIVASTRPHGNQGPTSIFAREPQSPTIRQDQLALDRGDLDVGGMDRMLESMTGIERTGPLAGRGKKVGFAAY